MRPLQTPGGWRGPRLGPRVAEPDVARTLRDRGGGWEVGVPPNPECPGGSAQLYFEAQLNVLARIEYGFHTVFLNPTARGPGRGSPTPSYPLPFNGPRRFGHCEGITCPPLPMASDRYWQKIGALCVCALKAFFDTTTDFCRWPPGERGIDTGC